MGDAHAGNRASALFLAIGAMLVVAVFIHCAATAEGMTTDVVPVHTQTAAPSSHGGAGLCVIALAAVGLLTLAAMGSIRPSRLIPRRRVVAVTRRMTTPLGLASDRTVELCVIRL